MRLVELARRRLKDAPKRVADEEDIAASVFHSLCRGAAAGRFQNVQNRDDLWWLLLAITKQKVVDHVRRETAQKRGAGRTQSESGLNGNPDDSHGFGLDRLVGDEPTPEFILMLEEQHERLLGLLRDDRLRQIAVFRIEGFHGARDRRGSPGEYPLNRTKTASHSRRLVEGARVVNHTPQFDGSKVARLAPADQVDLVCDEFEAAWTRGETPQIEDFLDHCDVSVRDSLLAELLLVDREFRIKRGGSASRNDYRQRFPDYSTFIDGLEFTTIDDRCSKRSFASRLHATATAGSKLAQFELLEELGSGASGTVWKARDTRLRRIVAVKIPRQERLSGPERDRFLREGQACAQLRHPNIVAVHEVGEDHGRAFIVAEFIEGLNLRQWLDQRRPKPCEAAELAAQLAEALHHAHEQGVIHRDLKPANVLIDSDGRPHVTDFGLAKWTTDSAGMTVEGNILGTPAYMSPEQARGNAFEVDRRTDVYGLGALLYEMLTGKPPFTGEVAAIVHQVIHDEPRPPHKTASAVPRDLETICLKAMEKEPNRRYPSAQEMAVDLRRFLRGQPILSRRAGWMDRCWRWIRHRPDVAAWIALALVALTSLGVTGLLAEKNRALLGLQTVLLTSDPAGAKVAFVPLSKTTGEPQLADVAYARGNTPVSVELAPGDYFVVADLPDGRFHEVFRHVPDPAEQVPVVRNHRFWRREAQGEIALPQIKIPSHDVVNGMAFIEGSDAFQMGVPNSTVLPAHLQRVCSVFVDTTEFTYADFERIERGSPLPHNSGGRRDENCAMPATYDSAVAFAEDAGKRLPTEAEFEFMATRRGTSKYPWGDTFPKCESPQEFGPVKSPDFDRLETNPPVFGLCSNLAEWTSTWANPYSSYPPMSGVVTLRELRIVRGGTEATMSGDPRVAPEARNPRERNSTLVYRMHPGVGFRCVRSAQADDRVLGFSVAGICYCAVTTRYVTRPIWTS